MRLRISLFDLLLLITPACAIVLGLLTAVVQSPNALYLLTIAQSVYLAAMLAAVCAAFHRSLGVRVFAGVFLAASLGHFLLLWLASQSSYGPAFPTTFALTKIWEQASPGQTAAVYTGVSLGGGWTDGAWTTNYVGGPVYPAVFNPYAGGMPGGATFPTYQVPIGIQRPLFVEVGVWAVSLLLGVLCGVAARSLRGNAAEGGSRP
jgi:hypothetical protein